MWGALEGTELSLHGRHFKVRIELRVWWVRTLRSHVGGIRLMRDLLSFHRLDETIDRGISSLLGFVLFFDLLLLLVEPLFVSLRFLFAGFQGLRNLLVERGEK